MIINKLLAFDCIQISNFKSATKWTFPLASSVFTFTVSDSAQKPGYDVKTVFLS